MKSLSELLGPDNLFPLPSGGRCRATDQGSQVAVGVFLSNELLRALCGITVCTYVGTEAAGC